MGGSAPIQEKSRRFCLFGVFPCHFGGPQNNSRKLLSGILEWFKWLRFALKAKQLVLWLRSRRRCSSLMALMAHQNTQIMQFLLPQTLKFTDSSCSLDRYSLWTSSGQVSSRSIQGKENEIALYSKFTKYGLKYHYNHFNYEREKCGDCF